MRNKRGRPEFQPTAALSRKVSIAAGGGMSHEEIALGLGISRNTLEKHFERELSIGAYERRIEVLEAMHRAAKNGNVAAQKAYASATPHIATPPSPEADTKPPATEPRVGKKEQAQRDAATAQAGTDWDTLLQRHNGAPLQ